ncbi:hypothetical protein NDU88_000492 [Pleurodeles waltl]|uniref:Uncharacterized protein n=1 Tax=Pleurodeles waltl TaxID=8319 RepID=A0AAV7SXG3_PLEWA|nr:hypothetical protein NDU88_000492 [Pleurodeles waltl]
MPGDDTGVDGAGVGGPGLQCGMGRCFVYLTSGVHRLRCRQRRRCQQEWCSRGWPGCGVSRRCRSASPQVAVRAAALRSCLMTASVKPGSRCEVGQCARSRCRPAASLAVSRWVLLLDSTKHTVPSAAGRGK